MAVNAAAGWGGGGSGTKALHAHSAAAAATGAVSPPTTTSIDGSIGSIRSDSVFGEVGKGGARVSSPQGNAWLEEVEGVEKAPETEATIAQVGWRGGEARFVLSQDISSRPASARRVASGRVQISNRLVLFITGDHSK